MFYLIKFKKLYAIINNIKSYYMNIYLLIFKMKIKF